MTELLSSTNMRLNLGQWHLCEALYKQITTHELSDEQRALTERKLGEVQERIRSGGGGGATVRLSAAEELAELLASPSRHADCLAADDVKKVLGLLRACGHGANKASDFEAAATWFDCAHALSGMPCDLLSAANMRAKLAKTSAVALAAYLHVLSLAQTGTPPSESELSMATAKRSALEQARAQRGTVAGGADGNREYF